jgi:hypothetical protein
MARIIWPRRSWGFPFVHYVQQKQESLAEEPEPEIVRYYEVGDDRYYFRR